MSQVAHAWAVYTYQEGAVPPCHVYDETATGVPLDQAEAEAAVERLKVEKPGLVAMAVPLEALPG